MKLFALPLVLVLAGCETAQIDHNAAAEFAVAQIRTWNALGVDPIQNPEYQPYVAAACGTIVGSLAFVEQEYLNADEIIAWCAVVNAAVGSGVP